jgi:protein gp37
VIWRDDAWALIRDCPNLIFMLVTKRPQLIGKMLPDFWPEIAGRVWLLTTVENQEETDRRVPALLRAFAYGPRPAVMGVSCEPLLGPVDLRKIVLRRDGQVPNALSSTLGDYIRPLAGNFRDLPRLNWVIAGGESGDEARPMHPDWLVSLCQQCEEAGVPFHFKQWGEFLPDQIGAEDARSIRLPIGHVEFKRVGKKLAGRRLFGVEHLGFPDA